MLVDRRRRRRAIRILIIAAVVAFILILFSLARFYTDVLWFREVGFTTVLWTSLRSQFGVGLVVGLITALIVWVNLILAGRMTPAYRVPRIEGGRRIDPMERYRELMGPYLGWLRAGVAIFIGFIAGVGATASWKTFLLWANRVSFGVKDPQFHKDIGFYVFQLPFYNSVLKWLWFALLAAVLVSLAAHYFHGAIAPERGIRGVAPAVLGHISVLLGLLALVKAVQYWVGRFGLDFSSRGVVDGASYTDVHAHLPALTLLAAISVVSAGLFIANIRFRRLSLPITAVGIWVLMSILAGALFPFLVQNFSVKPQESQRERPYIQRNLDATRAGFDLTDVRPQTFDAGTNLTSADVQANAPLLSNVRLWDPNVEQQSLAQLQSLRTYYLFKDVDVDRYQVDGQTRQVLLSAREIAPDDLQPRSKTWANLHLAYTHGYGIVASLANGSTKEGQPSFLVSDVPGTVAPGAETISPTQPRIYYGESFKPSEYSVVDSKQDEIDFPTNVGGVEHTKYTGTGGIPVGSFLRRVMFAIREGDPNLVLSSLIDSGSRIMIYKNVRDRVLRAAPFLSLDNDPYMAVVDGRLDWVLDAYTSTPYYPYSQRFDASSLVDPQQSGSLHGRVNYIRNSVKVVVDAYTGSMKFYVVDPTDPLIQAWKKVFPALFTAGEPSADLQAHFRYPEDLFDIQSEVYTTYHMTDPAAFYQKEDAWSVASNPLSGSQFAVDPTQEPAELPATYLLINLPGQSQQFLLTRAFTPRGRDNMVSYMTAGSDPGTYGDLNVLEFPRSRVIFSPLQINNLIKQDPQISAELTLLGRGESNVIFGSQIVLPINTSILYVQPLFVTASNVGNPELKRVVVVFGQDTVMGNTFQDAISQLFGTQEPSNNHPGGKPSKGGKGGGGTTSSQLQQLLVRAGKLYNQAQNALSNGNFAEYGRLIKELGKVLQRAQALSGQSPSVSTSP
ncbi:MAG: uncharacterized protein QOF16_1708, partial [Actinomycetota bacterium]|nr:uncharacterized protein [Actinomycetota bacterium]